MTNVVVLCLFQCILTPWNCYDHRLSHCGKNCLKKSEILDPFGIATSLEIGHSSLSLLFDIFLFMNDFYVQWCLSMAHTVLWLRLVQYEASACHTWWWSLDSVVGAGRADDLLLCWWGCVTFLSNIMAWYWRWCRLCDWRRCLTNMSCMCCLSCAVYVCQGYCQCGCLGGSLFNWLNWGCVSRQLWYRYVICGASCLR